MNERFPTNVFQTHWYCEAMSSSYKNPIKLLYATDEEGEIIVVITFTYREKENGLLDLFNPYGFGGIAFKKNLEDIYLEKLNNFFKEKGYVSGYFLQHPCLNIEGSSQWLEVGQNSCFLLDLSFSMEGLWSLLSKGHKYEINKAKKVQGLSITEGDKSVSRQLLNLYFENLKRVGANEAYYFSENTILEILNSNNTLILSASENGTTEAILTCLIHNEIAEYFISATTLKGRSYTRILLWELISKLKERGIVCLNLGGGVKEGDDLAKFKSRFGGKKVALSVSKRIFDMSKYDYLLKMYSKSNETDFFPAYWSNK